MSVIRTWNFFAAVAYQSQKDVRPYSPQLNFHFTRAFWRDSSRFSVPNFLEFLAVVLAFCVKVPPVDCVSGNWISAVRLACFRSHTAANEPIGSENPPNCRTSLSSSPRRHGRAWTLLSANASHWEDAFVCEGISTSLCGYNYLKNGHISRSIMQHIQYRQLLSMLWHIVSYSLVSKIPRNAVLTTDLEIPDLYCAGDTRWIRKRSCPIWSAAELLIRKTRAQCIRSPESWMTAIHWRRAHVEWQVWQANNI